MLAGLYGWSGSHLDDPSDKRIVLVQLLQTAAPSRQHKGLLPDPVHALGPHVGRPLNHDHDHLHALAKPRHLGRAPPAVGDGPY